jgi:hypothetical protein
MKNLILAALGTFLVIFGMGRAAFGNNPGGHYVQYTWTDTGTGTFNYYRGIAPGVCGAGKIPLVTGIPSTSYEDDTVVGGTSYYAAFTLVPSTGGESGCSAELQIAVPSVQGQSPTQVQGVAH